MGFELEEGDIFITMDGKTTPFAKGIPFTEEVEMSASDEPIHLYHFNDTPSVSFEVSGVDLALLNDYCNTTLPNGKFTIEHQIPIMIQARWHKNPRIRKKWLKRFGMKQDTVKLRVYAKVLEYHPGHILEEQYDPNGICATFDSLEFETDKHEYVWRPDQMRSGLKIEL